MVPRPIEGEGFVKGPIPMDWMRIADQCGARGTSIGLLIWYAAGWQRKNPIHFSQTIYTKFGVHAKTCRRVLRKMEQAGLVSVERHRGRSPKVTILPTPAEQVTRQTK